MQLNDLHGRAHTYVRSDAGIFLAKATRAGKRYSLVLVDPPSFFQDKNRNKAFDINRDHPQLIRDVIGVTAEAGEIFFSTNHQRFEPQLEGLPVREIVELTPKTIPEDYRNRRVHRCWRLSL